MSELSLIFVSGLLGSSHCVGMCGGFALTIGIQPGRIGSLVRRQLIYSSGRLMTYAFGGAIAGTVGMRLARSSLSLVEVQSALAVVAGLLLLWQGFCATGFRIPWIGQRRLTAAPCTAVSALKTFLTSPGLIGVFLAGLMTGFLPCGLVYAHLALASASGSLASGAAIMATFGAGTMPLMVLTGLGGRFLSLTVRRRLLTGAACCVMLTGALSIHRGAAAFLRSQAEGRPQCPYCQSADRPEKG